MTLFGCLGRAPRVLLAALALAISTAGCGNYSNEDLEYMSAIPEHEDVAIEVPRRGALVGLGAAEAWRTTVEVTRGLNRTAEAFLSLIDAIRNNTPTRRQVDQRIWGPYPDDRHPGWFLEFRMFRRAQGGQTSGFDYALVMIPPAGVALPANAVETTIIGGSFSASGGARVGAGQLRVTLADARAAGAEFTNLELLRTLTIDYQTRGWPRTISMVVENEPSDTEPVGATYDYEGAENGDGALTFTVLKDMVPAPLGAGAQLETLTVESQWLGAGAGRADMSVSGGNVPGEATALECWNDTYRSVYKTQSWDPSTTEGDPAACISRL